MQPLLMESVLDSAEDLDVAMYVVLSAVGLCLECMAYTKLYQWSIRRYARKFKGSEEAAFRPGRMQNVIGMACSGLFALIGLLAMAFAFEVFWVLWTLGAGVLFVVYVRQLVRKRPAGGKREKDPPAASPDVQRQLEQLRSLRDAGFLTNEEYREKRRRILEEL